MIFNPVDRILLSIEVCNENKNWFIDETYQLQTQESEKKKLSDHEVVTTFFTCFNKHSSLSKTIDLQKWERIKASLTKFVTKSKELTNEQKRVIQGQIENSIQLYIEAINPRAKVLRLVNQAKISVEDLRFLEKAVERLAAERISIHYLLFYLLAEWQKYIIGDIFESQGGAVKFCDKNTRFTIDWENSRKQSAEEFAISAKLEEAHSEGKGDYYPTLKKLIRTSIPVPPILDIWRSFYCIYQQDQVSAYFIEALAAFRGPISSYSKDAKSFFFSSELRELYNQFEAMQNSPHYRTTIEQKKKLALLREHLEKQLLLTATKYSLQENEINDFYKKLYSTMETQKKEHKGFVPADVTPLVGQKLPTPEEFVALKLPAISLDTFEQSVRSGYASYTSSLIEEDEAVTALFFINSLFGPEAHDPFPVEVLRRFCKYKNISRSFGKRKPTAEPKVEEVIEQLSTLSLAKKKITKPAKKNTVKKRKAAFPAPSITPKPSSQPKEKKETPIRQLTLQKPSLVIAPRVSDWYRDEPTALIHPPYNQLDPVKQSEAKLFHSYPYLVTQMLLKHTQPECYPSPTTNKLNKLYSRPGTIHRYETEEAPIQGYFADCFDEFELYHHFFHQRSFSDMMTRYAKRVGLINTSERQTIACEAKRLEKILTGDATTFAVGELDNRFTLIRKRFSVEIDDTWKKIRYTLCFPEWV